MIDIEWIFAAKLYDAENLKPIIAHQMSPGSIAVL